MSLYEVLDVAHSASQAEIRRAYLAKARLFHPDTQAEEADERTMQAVNEAWRVLSHPARRRAYDRQLGAPLPPPAPEPTTAPPTPGEYVAANLPEGELRAPRRADVLLLVPMALLVGAVASFAFAAMTTSAAVLGVAAMLLVLSGASFGLATFLVMARQHRRPWS